MIKILIVFTVCYVIITSYQAIMLVYKKRDDSVADLLLLTYQSTIIHVVEEVIPLCTIFTLHRINY